MSKIFFGFGHGFGGTHLLANLLNIHANIDCKHERKGSFSKYALFDKYMDVFHGKDSGVKAVEKERIPMVSQTIKSGKTFGEVNGILGFFVRALFVNWPNAKFIYMTRDPRAQVRTACNTGIFDRGVEQSILSSHPDWSSVWWWPRPSENNPLTKDWAVLSAFEKCAWFWSAYNEFVLEQVEELPEKQVFIYKFEDMVVGNRIMELYDFLGFPRPSEAQIQQIVSIKHAKTVARIAAPLPKWEQIPPAIQKRLLEFTEQTMKKLGYEV
jgi:hypothetical protein